MSAPSADARRARVAAEAAEWARRLNSAGLSATERGDLVDWLRESPVHVAEMLRFERLDSALGEFVNWSRVLPADPVQSDVVVTLATIGSLPKFENPRRRPRRARIAAIAAGVVLGAFTGMLGYRHFAPVKIATQVGERRENTLQDGSIVRLSPDTDLRVELKPSLRSVVLEHGEAVFRVAKDPRRPFVVYAAQARVQAVGTVFTVARSTDTVVVTVAEGRVAVLASGANDRQGAGHDPRHPIVLQPSDRVSISSAGAISDIRHIETSPTAEWDDKELIFENSRVADVVNRFNLRNRVQIRITGDALAARTVSGIFDADDPHSFVDFLTSVAGASSTQAGPDEIVVTPGTGARPAAAGSR
jgi:transmembrane sensor